MMYKPRRPSELGPVAERVLGAATVIPVAKTDPHSRVRAAFRACFARLEPLLGLAWLGAHERIREHAPASWSEIETAEAMANSAALAFMQGQGPEAAFARALACYENAWRSAAEVLRSLPAPVSPIKNEMGN